MKMEYVVRDDGAFRFDAPDRIAAFARANGQRLFGHTLVWYAQKPPAFERLDESRIAFADALTNYISATVGRYRGLACGWDVVNEAITDDGAELRESLWSQRLGRTDHMLLAYRAAHAADPEVPLFLNDYNLETLPRKRATFLRLAESLLRAGAPLGGLGTQTHVAADLAPGAIRIAIADLASLGLPIHVSEMDVSLTRARGLFKDPADLARRQARVYAEAAEAFSALPARQRFAFTLWGLRDRDSWLVRENAADTPSLFDAAGRPKPAAAAWARGIRG
jgi:endo-1,4-beta-xylanase